MTDFAFLTRSDALDRSVTAGRSRPAVRRLWIELLVGAVAITGLAMANPRTGWVGLLALAAFALRFADVGDVSRQISTTLPAIGWAIVLVVPSAVAVGAVTGTDLIDTLADALIVGCVLVAAILGADGTIRLLRRRRRLRQPVLMLGGPDAGDLYSRLIEDDRRRLVPIEPTSRSRAATAQDIAEILARRPVHAAFIFEDGAAVAEVDETIDLLLSHRVEVFVHAATRSWRALGTHVVSLDGTAFVAAGPHGFTPHQRRLKRLIDITVSAVALTLLLPLLVLVAALVKLSSRGPIVFRQTRLGQHNREFELLKFRSMREHENVAEWHPTDDELVTPIGRIIRATSIDELPQLVNILRGDMSLVGPRPERPFFADSFADIPGYADRLRLPVGLTGLAQIQGLRGDTSIPERVRYDNHYIETASLGRDVGIMLRTLTKLRMPEPDLMAEDATDRRPADHHVEIDLTESAVDHHADH